MLLEQLEEACRKLGRRMMTELPIGVGFALLLFDFGDNGNITYLSNARRADMVKALRELAAKIEAEPDAKVARRGRPS